MKKAIIIIAIAVSILCMGCRSKEQKCMETARMQCLGESMQNKPVEFVGGLEVSCKQARFEACMMRVKTK